MCPLWDGNRMTWWTCVLIQRRCLRINTNNGWSRLGAWITHLSRHLPIYQTGIKSSYLRQCIAANSSEDIYLTSQKGCIVPVCQTRCLVEAFLDRSASTIKSLKCLPYIGLMKHSNQASKTTNNNRPHRRPRPYFGHAHKFRTLPSCLRVSSCQGIRFNVSSRDSLLVCYAFNIRAVFSGTAHDARPGVHVLRAAKAALFLHDRCCEFAPHQ